MSAVPLRDRYAPASLDDERVGDGLWYGHRFLFAHDAFIYSSHRLPVTSHVAVTWDWLSVSRENEVVQTNRRCGCYPDVASLRPNNGAGRRLLMWPRERIDAVASSPAHALPPTAYERFVRRLYETSAAHGAPTSSPVAPHGSSSSGRGEWPFAAPQVLDSEKLVALRRHLHQLDAIALRVGDPCLQVAGVAAP